MQAAAPDVRHGKAEIFNQLPLDGDVALLGIGRAEVACGEDQVHITGRGGTVTRRQTRRKYGTDCHVRSHTAVETYRRLINAVARNKGVDQSSLVSGVEQSVTRSHDGFGSGIGETHARGEIHVRRGDAAGRRIFGIHGKIGGERDGLRQGGEVVADPIIQREVRADAILILQIESVIASVEIDDGISQSLRISLPPFCAGRVSAVVLSERRQVGVRKRAASILEVIVVILRM